MPFSKPLLDSRKAIEFAHIRVLKMEAGRILMELRHREHFRLAKKLADKADACGVFPLTMPLGNTQCCNRDFRKNSSREGREVSAEFTASKFQTLLKAQ
jgi:hypothetical protein